MYINPEHVTKEEWLFDNAVSLPSQPARHRTSTHVAVCLVDNGAFTAAGVIFSDQELTAFTDFYDERPKAWFIVPIARLADVGLNPDDVVPL